MDDLYHDHIIEHYTHPVGRCETPPEGAIAVEASHPSCGDTLILYAVMDGARVALSWQGAGCAISQASMSVVSQWAQGKTITQLQALDTHQVLSLLGLSEISVGRERCAFLSLEGVQALCAKVLPES